MTTSQTLIRKRYYDFLTGRITPEDFKFVQGTSGQNGSNELPHLGDLHKGAAHIDHCFDYLQQGIRCAGQMDLEYPVGTGDAGFLAGEYRCKSWVSSEVVICLRQGLTNRYWWVRTE
jgi:hypothetical protein